MTIKMAVPPLPLSSPGVVPTLPNTVEWRVINLCIGMW